MRTLIAIAAILTIAALAAFYIDNRETIQDALRIIAWAIAASILILTAGLVWILHAKQTRQMRKAHDGSFLLQHHWHEPFIRRAFNSLIGRPNTRIVYNPNKDIWAATAIGQHGVRNIPGQHSVDHQLQFAKSVQLTHHMQAATPGDDAIRHKFGAMYRPGRSPITAAAAKHLTGPAVGAPLAAPADESESQPKSAPITLAQAFATSRPDHLIVGQSETGQIAAFNPGLHASAAIVGNTGTGKTASAGFTLAAAAARNGYQLIILDPDGGADWKPFAAKTEHHQTDRDQFPHHIAALHKEFERREHPPLSGEGWGGVLVIIEEYGDLIRQLRLADKKSADHVDAQLDTLMRRGRKRNLYFCLIDQYPQHWSNQVLSAVKFRVVFQLGPNQGAKLQEYKADKLPPRGQFLQNNIRYDAWHAAPQLRALLAACPPTSARPIIDQPPPAEPVETEPVEAEPRSWTVHPETDPPPTDDQPANGNWDTFVDEWFATQPPDVIAVQANLARDMAKADPRKRPHTSFKGLANKYYHQRHAERTASSEDPSPDPEIIESGTEAAAEIAKLLRSKKATVEIDL